MAKVSLSSYSSPKSLPKRYKANDAPYAVGGNAGIYIAARPKKYPLTPQQRKVSDCAAECKIFAGMTKAALMKTMKSCVPTCFGHKAKAIPGSKLLD